MDTRQESSILEICSSISEDVIPKLRRLAAKYCAPEQEYAVLSCLVHKKTTYDIAKENNSTHQAVSHNLITGLANILKATRRNPGKNWGVRRYLHLLFDIYVPNDRLPIEDIADLFERNGWLDSALALKKLNAFLVNSKEFGVDDDGCIRRYMD